MILADKKSRDRSFVVRQNVRVRKKNNMEKSRDVRSH